MHESEKWKWSCSVVSDSSWPHGLQPTRLLHPWDFPGKSTGVGCHHLLRNIVTVKYTQVLLYSRLDLHGDMRRNLLPFVAYHYRHVCSVTSVSSDCDPMVCGSPGSSVHGILQARILGGLPFPPPRDLLNPGIEPEYPASPAFQADSFHWAAREPWLITSVLF